MPTTALDIITGAAKLLGVIFKSEALSADEASDGLVALNDMLDSWSNDDLVTYAYALESFTMTGAASYTMGTGGALNTTRPVDLVQATIRTGGVDYALDIITPEEFQNQISVKNITSAIAQYLTYDNNYPLATIKMYPIPASGSTLSLMSNKPLANLASLTSTVDLPPGWKRAMKYNLAIDLAPEYGVEVNPAVVDTARKALGAIKHATNSNKSYPLIPSMSGGKAYILGNVT